MKQYYFRENTPLMYHNFLRYFGLPLGIVRSFGQLIALAEGMETFNGLYAVDFAVYIASVALMITAFVGFFGWKSYAWICLMVNYGLGVAYSAFLVVVYAILVPDELGYSIGMLVGQVIVLIPFVIYYHKRKPLFFADAAQAHFDAPERRDDPWAVPDRPAPGGEKYCRMCGFELLPDSMFCSKCGTAVAGGTKTVPVHRSDANE